MAGLEPENNNNNELVVFPNPSSNGLFHLNTDALWEVYSIDGKQISKGEGSIINLSAFPSGYYLLKSDNLIEKIAFKKFRFTDCELQITHKGQLKIELALCLIQHSDKFDSSLIMRWSFPEIQNI